MTQFLKKILGWLAKLAFWRESALAADLPSEVEPEADRPRPRASAVGMAPEVEAPVAKLGVLARLKNLFTFRRRKAAAVAVSAVDAESNRVVAGEPKRKPRATDVAEEPEIPEPKPSFFARLRQSLIFRREPIEAEAEPDDRLEKSPQKKSRLTDKPEEIETPEPKPGFFARLKPRLSFRRKRAPSEIEGDENDKTLVIDQANAGSEATTTEGEAAAPSRGKRFLLRLRSKWVWIPALSVTAMGLISWGIVTMLHTAHEKARLQVELAAAKKMLEKKSVASVVAPAPTPLTTPAKPEKKIDPAFQIIGHVPAPRPDATPGLDPADCVVKDKKSVAENLKNCITGFNQAIASAPEKTKKP